MKSRRFWPLASIIILPVLVLAGVAAYGLSAQRRAALADAQAQARDVAVRLSSRLDAELTSAAGFARFTDAILLPAPPPAEAREEMAALYAARDARDVTELKRLAMYGRDTRSAAGLPVSILAALSGLELDELVPEFFTQSHVTIAPSVLTEKWLLRVEEAAARERQVAPADVSNEHPVFQLKWNAATARQYWTHDEWVRRAFWDAPAQKWKTRVQGAHVIDGEAFWLSRAKLPGRPPESAWPHGAEPAGGSPPGTDWDMLAVLTEDNLAGVIGAAASRYELPAWMGLSVMLEGVPLHSTKKHPVKSAGLAWSGSGPKQIVEGMYQETEWLELSPAAEPLAAARGHFTVQISLKNSVLLYAATDRMARWTSWTLASAVLTAGIGLWLVRRTLNKERRLGELKSQFVSSVSHELRAPIGSLRLMAEGLASGRVKGEAAGEFHRLMAGEGARLSSLIENVLDFARIEQGRKEYVMAETDMAALLGDAVALMQPQAEAKGLRIVLECEPLPFVPKVDAGAVQQAVINLLDNAVKFTPPVAGAAGPPRSPDATGGQDAPATVIRVGLAPEPGHWSLTVTDPGPGIPREEHARIFERFYRLGNELRRETTGTGIGLALVKHIAEGHGGRVTVESAVGQGSTFTLRFPVLLVPLVPSVPLKDKKDPRDEKDNSAEPK